MPQYFYVKTDGANDGTATGDEGLFSSKQTGAFSALDSATAAAGTASYYASITTALAATSFADGDVICCSDLHDLDLVATSTTYTITTDETITIESVDDTAVETYKAGATERHSSGTGADLLFTGAGRWRTRGMTFTAADRIILVNTSDGEHVAHNCTFKSLDNGQIELTGGVDGAYAELVNCSIILEATSVTPAIEAPSSGCRHVMIGGSITTPNDATVANLYSGGFQSGGGSVYYSGVDLSFCDTTLVAGVGSAFIADNTIDVVFENCHVKSGVALTSESFSSRSHTALMTGCGFDTDAEWQYRFETLGGSVEAIDTIYRTATETYASGAQTSLKCITLATALPESPFSFEFPAVYAALATASTDTLRIHFYIPTGTTLDDGDVWASMTYPDGTNRHISNTVYSVTNAFSSMRTAGSLAAGDTDWTGDGGSDNYYQLDLTTSGDIAANGIGVITMYIASANKTFYFCPTIEIVA